jgi:hypothetical protein
MREPGRDSGGGMWCNRYQDGNNRRRPMTLNAHIEELRKKHEALSLAVEDAQRSPGSDDLEIAEMKKQKLKIKEEIARLSHA